LSTYSAAHLDEIDEANDGRCPWRPIRHHFGITSFGVNAWTGRNAGDRIINEHAEFDPAAGDTEEDADEELYLVHSGRARFELDGQHLDAPAGTFVFVPPAVKRTAFAEEPGTTIVAVGGVPGKAYEASGWEVWRPFHELYEAGKFAEAADRARETVEASGTPQPLYNLACCESLAGRTADAIEHFRLALDSTDQYRERLRSLATQDSDLDPIRDEPAFKELVG
jgi:mannose-6-phosphate isomerase-like protein (cupin superfamily)